MHFHLIAKTALLDQGLWNADTARVANTNQFRSHTSLSRNYIVITEWRVRKRKTMRAGTGWPKARIALLPLFDMKQEEQ